MCKTLGAACDGSFPVKQSIGDRWQRRAMGSFAKEYFCVLAYASISLSAVAKKNIFGDTHDQFS